MPFDFSLVTAGAVRALLAPGAVDCVDVVRQAYVAHRTGSTVNPPSVFLRVPERPNARIIALPAHLGGEHAVSGIKWIASYPDNVRRGFPRASAVLVLNDAATGYPFACMEASIISAARTAASAVLGAELLAGQRRAGTIGFVGTGLIARAVYEFLLGTGWQLDAVQLFDVSPDEATRFAREVCRPAQHAEVARAPTIESLIRSSDLIVFATVASAPHVHDLTWFAHAPVVLHLSLRDLSPAIILSAFNVVDDVAHVLTASTSPHLAEQQVGHRRFIAGTVADLISGEVQVDTAATRIFSPFGLGVLDLAVGRWLFELARASGDTIDVPNFFDLAR